MQIYICATCQQEEAEEQPAAATKAATKVAVLHTLVEFIELGLLAVCPLRP
jgi:hypothetical protein